MLIFDGSHILHRCKYAAHEIDWRIYCYLASRIILSTVAHFQDKDVIVCWDHNQSYRRKRVMESYKQRKDPDKTTVEGRTQALELIEYVKARKWLHNNLPQMGLMSLQVQGIEADDIAYWLITDKLPRLNIGTERTNYFCTSDKDWCQFINEHWYWYDPVYARKVSTDDTVETRVADHIMTYEEFVREYGSRERFILRKALLGDRSDNIPKCPLVGDKVVNTYIDKLINGELATDSSKTAVYLRDFIRSGQLTKNIELIDFEMLGRGERRKLHIAYEDSKSKVSYPNLIDWLRLGSEINSTNMLEFGRYLNFN